MMHEITLRLWLNGPARQIGWLLVHSVWQGAIAALLLAIVLRLMERRSSGAKYLVSCAALLAVPAASFVTFSLRQKTGAQLVAALPGPAIASTAMPVMPAVTAIHQFDLQQSLGYAATAWIVGVALLAVWHLCGWLNLLRWRAECSRIEGTWRSELDSMMKRMRMTGPIRLLGSARLATPAVVGILKPAILIPIALAAELTPEQAAAILAHELAHIRRHDYLFNLIQTAIETLLFYHPAVWWISSQIRRERENCCDDLAAAMSDPIEYSRALLAAEGLRATPLAMGLGGHGLASRIGRLIDPRPSRRRGSALVAASIFVVLACVAAPMRSSFGQNPAAPTTQKQNAFDVVVTASGILVDHKINDWGVVRRELSLIDPAVRAKMRLNLSAESANIPFGTYMQAQGQASQIVHDLGLAYLSNTGIADDGAQSGMVSMHAKEMSFTTSPAADGSPGKRVEIRPVRDGDNLGLEVTQIDVEPVQVKSMGNHLAAELQQMPEPDEKTLVGEYYMGGQVKRDGVYSLTHRKITLKEAITAAGGVDGDPTAAHLDLIRRTNGGDVFFRGISVADLFDGKIADVFLLPYDEIMVLANPSPATYP
jgi:beta-lactamase regulating signal transducer with metallopeptidase domain